MSSYCGQDPLTLPIFRFFFRFETLAIVSLEAGKEDKSLQCLRIV